MQRKDNTALAAEEIISLGSPKITKILTLGTAWVTAALLILLIAYEVLALHSIDPLRIGIGLTGLGYVLLSHRLAKTGHHRASALMLISLFLFMATLSLLSWGINMAAGLLVLGFSLFTSGIMLGTGAIIPVSTISIAIIAVVHTIHKIGYITPAREALALPSHAGDIITYSTLFSIFGLVSWISARHLSLAFNKLAKTEAALREQKNTLAIRLEEETRKLRKAQLAEMRQLYTFAEIGQTAAATLHELSNQLSVLNFDIDSIKKNSRNSAVVHAQESIDEINTTIKTVRGKMNNPEEKCDFNPIAITKDTISLCQKDRPSSHIILEVKSNTQNTLVYGSPLSLSHILTILVNNSTDAGVSQDDHETHIIIGTTGNNLTIRVSDNGPGVPVVNRKNIFSPKRSSKENGLGIGLYIARHMAKTQFGGNIILEKTKQGASFLVTLPLNQNI